MRSYCYKIIFAVIMSGFCCSAVFAADSEYRFTHNDHDTLIIGEITSITNSKIEIKASDYIVSTKHLNEGDKKEQLRPETAIIPVSSHFNTDKLNIGDYVIASLNKKGNEFEVAWGIHRIDSTDYETLNVLVDYSLKTSAVYTDFVNSGGAYNEFSFANNTVIRVHDGIETIIYSENPAQTKPVPGNEPMSTEDTLNQEQTPDNTDNTENNAEPITEIQTDTKTSYTYNAFALLCAAVLVFVFFKKRNSSF